MQLNVQYVIAIVAFAVQDVAYLDVINAIVHHVCVTQAMFVIHVVLSVIAHHANAIFEHALHVTLPVIILAKCEYLIYFNFFLDKIYIV